MASRPSVPIETLLSQREWVRSLARRLVAGEAEADDLAQQVWVDALRSPPERDDGIRGWFATLLRRRARDAWRGDARRAAREGEAARPDAARATADVVADAEAHRLVVEAALALEEPYRETILLRFFEELPPREIAARQGVPVETVRTRTRRALERLRERLDAGAGGSRGRWMAALLPLTLPGAGGLGMGMGGGGAGPPPPPGGGGRGGGVGGRGGGAAPPAAGGAVVGTKTVVAGGVVVAAGLALLLGSELLSEGAPELPPSSFPVEEEEVPPPAPEPPPLASAPAAAPASASPEAAPPAPETPPPEPPRILLKGRVRDLDGNGVGGVDLVAHLLSGAFVPPPAEPRLEDRESEDLRTFYAQVGRDRGKGSVRGRSEKDGTFLLELPAKGRYGLVAFARQTLLVLEESVPAGGWEPGAVIHVRAYRLKELQRLCMDRERTAAERVEALGHLSTAKGGRDEGVVAAMAVLLPRVPEAPLRAALLRHLRGSGCRSHLTALVEALRADGAVAVRVEAALCLGDLLDDPMVRSALEAARDGDADTSVREAAAGVLAAGTGNR